MKVVFIICQNIRLIYCIIPKILLICYTIDTRYISPFGKCIYWIPKFIMYNRSCVWFYQLASKDLNWGPSSSMYITMVHSHVALAFWKSVELYVVNVINWLHINWTAKETCHLCQRSYIKIHNIEISNFCTQVCCNTPY